MGFGDISLATWIIIAVVAYAFYWWFTDVFNFWKKKGVPHPKPSIFFGNIRDSILMKKNVGVVFEDIYKKFKDYKYVGIYNFREPSLLLIDPEVVKTILVKDYSSFAYNGIEAADEDDILARNPFVLKGEEWKATRSQLTPCFSSGKIKQLFPLIEEVGKKFVRYLEREQTANPGVPLESKEISSKYTTENIATCAFGLEGKCFEDPKAEFREIGKAIFAPSLSMTIKTMLIFFAPWLNKLLKIRLVPDKLAKRLKSIVLDTIKYRSENKVVRNDFLDLMNELKSKPGEYQFTDRDIVSHAASFFVDGFETSSVTLSFALYELGYNLDVQRKLREEIEESYRKNGGKLSYEAVQDMAYLDCVLNESLRMRSPGLFMKKICTQRYELEPPKGNGPRIVIEPDTSVIIPVIALHNDPDLFPEPDKFIPERFSAENRKNVAKCSFLPFGDGPRVCLGQRFALMQVKVAIVYVIKNFEVRVNSKTKTPIEIDPLYFLYAAKGGLWLNFYKLAQKE